MKKLYLIPLSLIALSLVACGTVDLTSSNSYNDSEHSDTPHVSLDSGFDDDVILPSMKSAETLAYQAVPSVVTLSHQMMPTMKAKKAISTETKNQIETLLPTIDLLINNASFESELAESEIADYQIKQTITFTDFDLTSQTMELYYNVTVLENRDRQKRAPGDIDSTVDSSSDVSSDTPVTDTTEEPSVESDVTSDPTDETSSLESDSSSLTSEVVSSEETTTPDVSSENNTSSSSSMPMNYEVNSRMEGIVKYGENTYPFIGENEVENEHDEHETELELRIFTNDAKTDFIKVKQEIEIEDNETEEEYKYEVYQNKKVVSSFAFEKENENMQDEIKIKLLLEGTKYSFKVYNEREDTFIEIKVDGKNDQDSKITYKKVVTEDQNGNKVEQFVEVQ